MPSIVFSSDPQISSDFISLFVAEPNYFADLVDRQIFDDHPDLERKLAGLQNGKKKKIIREYVLEYTKKNRRDIQNALNEQKTAWNKIGDQVLLTLSKLLNTDWEGINEIRWDVGIAQIYPRELDMLLFQTFYLQYVFQAIPMALHELTHFIYFKKWHELFPGDEKETFEAPHPYWHLSEMMAPIINSEDDLRRLIPDANTFNDPIYHAKPFNEESPEISMQGYFTQKYIQFKSQGKGIDSFLRSAREDVQKIDFD